MWNTYIDTNLANDFIKLFKSYAKIAIFLYKKLIKTFTCIYIIEV